uniref:Androgen-binding protein homolog n=1 Tax=Moschus moschiferus TaxID=68415 RepID=A0A8C6FET7_MOSMO
MKGALLVLALMVTRELIFETTEACPAFYTVFGVLSLGNKELLNVMLDQFNATDEEKAALGKIQDCFNEAGFEVKFLDLLLMVIYPSLTPTLRIHMQHSVTCHTVIDHAVMGYATEKSYEQRSTIKPLLQRASPIICKHNPPAHPASHDQTCSYHAN